MLFYKFNSVAVLSLIKTGSTVMYIFLFYFLLQIKVSNIVINLKGKNFNIPVWKKMRRLFLESEIAVEEQWHIAT